MSRFRDIFILKGLVSTDFNAFSFYCSHNHARQEKYLK